MNDLSLDELRDELSDFAAPAKKGGLTPRQERIIAGFEEIQQFVDREKHAPRHGEQNDIFERLYATRLDRLRLLDECREILTPLDRQGLLAVSSAFVDPVDEMDDDALAAELGDIGGTSEITTLRHVRSGSEKREAEEIANRTPCKDFEEFRPIFDRIRSDLAAGIREARPFQRKQAEIKKGEMFIVGGQIAYVADVGEEFFTEYDRRDSRLRVIYDNATESNVLARSLQRALYREDAGRRITDPSAGPLFKSEAESGDLESGTIYVLRSRSDHPTVVANRDLLHKIGVTGGDVSKRVAIAKADPTFLMADVEIVAEYKLFNINRVKLENLLHRIFAPAQVEISVKDRFGQPVVPREWFLVPLPVVDDVVERIKNGSITRYAYDSKEARLVLQEIVRDESDRWTGDPSVAS